MAEKETVLEKISRSFIRWGQLVDLSWCITVKGSSIDDMTIRAFVDDNDTLGKSIPISGYQAKENRGPGDILDLAYGAKGEDGVSHVVINVPQENPKEMYHQIVIR